MTKKSLFHLFHRLLRVVQQNSWLVVICTAVVLAVSLYGARSLRFELDIYDVYNPNFQSSKDLEDLKSEYDDSTQILVYFHFQNEPTNKDICELLHWGQETARFKSIKSATSVWSLRAPKVEEDRYWYMKILDDPCTLPASEKADLSSVKSSYFNQFLSPSGTKDLVFDVSFSGDSLELGEIQEFIDQTETMLKDKTSPLEIRYLGLAGFRYYFKKILSNDRLSSFIIILIIFLFLRFIYGTWICGLLLVATLILTIIVLYGAMGLVGIPIDILTNNLFLMTTVAATADFIFVTHHQLKFGYQQSLEDLMPACCFTTLTTVIGFLTLNTSDVSLICRFGTAAGLGAMLEWVMMFVVLPACLKVLKKEQVWVKPTNGYGKRWLEVLERFSLPPFVLKLMLFLMVLSIPAFFFLNDQDSPVKNLPRGHELRVGYEKFKEKFQWEGQAYLYFPEQPSQEEHDRIIRETKELALVHKVEDPLDILTEWTKGMPDLRKKLVKREMTLSPLWKKYFSLKGSLRIPLYFKEQDLHSLRKLRDQVKVICGNSCRLAGQRVVYLEYGERISRTLLDSFVVSVVLVIFILAYLLWISGKIQHLWPVVLSSLMGPLIILTCLAIFQVQVTVITSIFLAVMVGLAGDNAIQYILTPEDDLSSGIDSRAQGSIIVALVMMMASGLFLLQTLRAMQVLGALFVFGFFINLLGDLFGLKGLLAKRSS